MACSCTEQIQGHPSVDLVNKASWLVNKPKWHFEMACMLLMIRIRIAGTGEG